MDPSVTLQRIRALGGYTQADLARLVDVAPSTISRIEKRQSDPTWSLLNRILDASGYVITGGTIASAGDSSAIAAARVLIDEGVSDNEWTLRWVRAGWVTPRAIDVARIAVQAGNAGKFSRRPVRKLTLEITGSWMQNVAELAAAGIDYAVTGITAARRTAGQGAASPVAYVTDLDAVRTLGWASTGPGRGLLLVEPDRGQMRGAAKVDGVQMVTPTQGLLDAFAAGGRQADKAQDMVLSS